MSTEMRVRSPLFDGLDAEALEDVHQRMTPRKFAARETICREGDRGDSLLVIRRGLAEVSFGEGSGRRTIARLRRGDVLGELSLITDEPRSATVVATMPTEALELGRDAFAALLARYPIMLVNLNTILGRRLAERNVAGETRGEAVALVADSSLDLLMDLVSMTKTAAPSPVAALTLSEGRFECDVHLDEPTGESALSALDDLLDAHRLALVHLDPQHEDLLVLLEQMDRVLVVVSEADARRLSPRLESLAGRAELALLAEDEAHMPPEMGGLSVVRSIAAFDPSDDVAWLARHLSRTKLGLALGAGGAKGYAHVALLYLLEEAGYTVDYVAGSSIGAMVGAWLGLGRTAAEVEDSMRQAFTPDNVDKMFKLSIGGMSSGLDVHVRACRETTDDCTFADLEIPLVAMAVDLVTRQPAPITEGPLWEAMVASTAVAGMFPPHERGSQQLVDGIALVPVPSDAVREAGADVVVSVNLISHDTLDAWPGQSPPAAKPKRARVSMLDSLLQVMDLSQLDSSVRHAARADVVITPRFGPGSWRDFHLAEQFAEAGRTAAEPALQSLRQLALPQPRLSGCGSPGG